MKAIVCSEFGPLESLQLKDVEMPPLAEGHVRIEVQACGVNFPDVLMVEGRYQHKPPLPFSPGGEVSGQIVELGEGVTEFATGQRVMANTFWGGMAQLADAPSTAVIPIPDTLDYATASVFQGGHLTSYYALKQRGCLQPGENLLVLGAAGGVGTAAVQLGKVMGARVIAAVSSEEKAAFARSNGADEVVNYATENLKESVKELTGGAGADVIYDPVGGEAFDLATRCITWNGRLLVVGFASGTIPKYSVNLALLKGCSVVGVNYLGVTLHEPEQSAANIAELMQLLDEGAIMPKIDKIFPLHETTAALNYVRDRRAMGKVVVGVSEDLTPAP